MDRLPFDITDARLVAEALAIGLLVGIERYKARQPGEKHTAGVRTFAAFALLGGVCGLFDQLAVSLASFAALTALVAIGYYRESEHSLGLTTETAALLVFWLGVLVHRHEFLALSTAIVLTIMLASKESIHAFIRESISERELFDTLKFLAVVLVIYPLLPDRTLGPYGFFNPAKTWLLVILVSTIGYVGYFLMRVLGRRRGLLASSLLGGVISTPATTMSLAVRARQSPESARILGVAAVAANAVQFPRLLLLVAVLDTAFARRLFIPLAAMTVVGFLGAWLLSLRSRERHRDFELPLANPYSLMPALKFSLFFVAILFLVRVAEISLGEPGVYLASFLGGLASASAVALTLAKWVQDGSLSLDAGTFGILIAVTANALVKCMIPLSQGPRRLAVWLIGGLATMLIVGFALVFMTAAGSAAPVGP
ncbi:MAG: MgtC/SapB family protein [Acidobacteriota bacterium]|nr:MgtC/SapB family protein [Acidobacteriota bacterium]